jgi:tRNA modification GTPase
LGEDLIDEALVLSFEEGESFTGERVVELQTHGSPAVVSAVLRALGASGAMRPAGPGEFTRQALVNDKLDLARVEGLADLLEAETDLQRRQANRLFSGELGRRAAGWRDELLRARALSEAMIDFADEGLPDTLRYEVLTLAGDVCGELKAELEASRYADRLRDGFEVAIVGPPNAGKSTLLNRIARREVAITSERAGTTRDVVEVRLDLEGLPVTLLDTAGLRSTDDEIEQIGIARAIERAAAADLRVFLQEPGQSGALAVEFKEGDLQVWAKADLGFVAEDQIGVSGLTGAGVDTLISLILQRLQGRVSDTAILGRERHRLAVQEAVLALEQLLAEPDILLETPEIASEHLASAMSALDGLVGRVDVEDILGEIFSSFCIGK